MASKFQFIGASYNTRSSNFDCQRTVNLYPTVSENQTSKNIVALVGTPGLLAWTTLPVSPIRKMYNTTDRTFAVAGDTLYELNSDATYTSRGTILTSTGAISMADNGSQLCIVDGANGYILTLATNVFTQITAPAFLGANTVCYLDGYFVFNKPNSNIYFISALNDGLSYDALEYASANGSPDNLVGVSTVHQQVWLFGTQSIQIVYNSGNTDFPLDIVQNVFIEYGCVAAQSIVKTANTVFWLGRDEQGSGVVFMANGYQPQRISTYPIEYAIQSYGTISDAVGYTYQENGHYFYVLNFTSANTTWVYDIGLQQWHERAFFNNGSYERHRGQTHVYAFGKHLVGDYVNGIIYEQSLSYYDDNGTPKRWMRAAPHLADMLEYIYYNYFQLDMETGVGLIDGATQDVTPRVMLQWSDDGGHTWSNEHWKEAGKIGQYKTRVRWNRLGRSRDRVFRVAGSYACKTWLINGIIDTQAGSN